jgi:hypothetical protein
MFFVSNASALDDHLLEMLFYLQTVGKDEEATCYAVATLIYTNYVRARKHARAMSDDGLLNK